MFFGNKRLYSLHKAKQILRTSYTWYKKRGKQLATSHLQQFEGNLQHLDQAILNQDRTQANTLARELETFNHAHFKKTLFEYTYEIVVALLVALAVATVVRQSWFELYEIPTGSMRPTFEEQDHLTVSKLAYAINTPLKTEHLYFDPNLVQRGSIVIFSGDKVPIIDATTQFLWVLPYTKRYIKRCIAKPGDTVYFYGGHVYVVDKGGNWIEDLINGPWMKGLEHVPFITFEGRVTSASQQNYIYFNQMYKPIGRLSLIAPNSFLGEVFNGNEWVKDQPTAQKTPHDKIQTYSDFWGFRNYAMARILTKEQLKFDTTLNTEGLEDAPLYLELRHTPSLSYPMPKMERDYRGFGIYITPFKTVIPLDQSHLNALMDHMYTARFVIKDGKAYRYSLEQVRATNNQPAFPNVPDGTYEFYYGKAVRIGWGGIPYDLPSDHPLYAHTSDNIQKLYNLGIDLDQAYNPQPNQHFFPQRYAYFRNGDLYLLGGPIFLSQDAVLTAFHERETKLEQASSAAQPYVAFKDYGAPIKEGKIDKAFMDTFGVKVPEKQYMVLGDNHAMSSDSRVFGFIPENNLQGAPSLILWPPSSRLGAPMQKPYPIFNIPRLIVWSLIAAIALAWYFWRRHRMKQPVFKRITFS